MKPKKPQGRTRADLLRAQIEKFKNLDEPTKGPATPKPGESPKAYIERREREMARDKKRKRS